MPEGDTVWLTARRLHAALAGRRLTTADLRVPTLATVDLRGRDVLGVVPRGKHLLIRLDDGRTLHSHLKMDGSWYLTRAGLRSRRLAEHHIRVLLGNAEWSATGHRIHNLVLIATKDEEHVVGHLGPDLLGPDWDPGEAARRLCLQPGRAIGEALLDQSALAGIGNLYKSEVLFLRGVNPWTPVAEVSELGTLVELAHTLLVRNREHPEQSTTGSMARGQQHWVYERRGEPCRRCRTIVQRAEQGDPAFRRSTYWCPSCQPADQTLTQAEPAGRAPRAVPAQTADPG